jgi:hypothetical protein
VCIGQPARYSGSFIDLSDPDAAQDVASAASLAKAVSIRQPAPRYSGSVIDLSAPDAALAVTSALPAKPVFICQPATRYSGLSLICGPLQMGRWLWHPRRRQSLCLGNPPVW